MQQADETSINIEMAQQLVNIGLLASWEGMGHLSDSIFAGIIAEYPDLASVKISYAVTLVSTHRYAEAMELLQAVMRTYPDHMMAKSVLALLQKEMGESQWRTHARAVIKNGQDEIAVDLAKSLLGEDDSNASKKPRVFPTAQFA
jgi:predicted Zn-dependent protease